MSNIPCPSDYHSGDEHNPGSPDYIEPDQSFGGEPVQFPWYFHFDPPHPTLGEEARAIISGELQFTDTAEVLSPREMRRLSSWEDWDGPNVERTYDDFIFEKARLADGRILNAEQLAAEPGFGTIKDQIYDYKSELIESAQEAIDKPIKVKKDIRDLLETWRQERTPLAILDVSTPKHKL